jgi:RimJ/RimL family protein N-acetyltransferase
MTPQLEIDGGVLRPWEFTDAQILVQGWLDPDVAAWNSVPSAPTLATATSWIAGVQDRAAITQSIDWVIESYATHGVVGEVGLSGFSDAHRGALIGYWLLPEGRGQGLATAAVTAVTGWAHQALSLATIVARCNTSNTASQQVAARAGYRHERADATGHQLWISRTRES